MANKLKNGGRRNLLIVLVTGYAFNMLAGDRAGSCEAVVRAQVEAYNARDLEVFAATYVEDAQLFEHPDKLIASGLPQLRARYAERFKEPNLHAVILSRMVMGNVFIDHEKVTRAFAEGSGVIEAVAIYEVANGRITKAG
jgi:putative hydrolase of HD superfamily